MRKTELEFDNSNPRLRRILVVDDHADGAELLAEVLRVQGHEVEIALDGAQALSRLSAFRPSIAILDIALPNMDGYELAVRLREEIAPAPRAVIAVSGYGRAQDHERSRVAGFAAHLVKPLDPEALLRVIADL